MRYKVSSGTKACLLEYAPNHLYILTILVCEATMNEIAKQLSDPKLKSSKQATKIVNKVCSTSGWVRPIAEGVILPYNLILSEKKISVRKWLLSMEEN